MDPEEDVPTLVQAVPPPPALGPGTSPSLPPTVLRVLPLPGLLALIGYIYDATPDPEGGLLMAMLAFFSFQGHQVFYNPCPDLEAYHQGVSLCILMVDCLPNHILLSGLEIMEGLFAPSPAKPRGTSFMAAYITPPANSAPAGGTGLPMRSTPLDGVPHVSVPMGGGLGVPGVVHVVGNPSMGGPLEASRCVSVPGFMSAPPISSTSLRANCSLHSSPGGLPVCHPPSAGPSLAQGFHLPAPTFWRRLPLRQSAAQIPMRMCQPPLAPLMALRCCENILCGYLYDGDLAFVILKGIHGFKFPKRFLEISSRDLTSFLLQLN
jgi:hypothetical protein